MPFLFVKSGLPQISATLGEVWCNKMNFSGFVDCQGIVCSNLRDVRDGQHRDLVLDLGCVTPAFETMLVETAC